MIKVYAPEPLYFKLIKKIGQTWGTPCFKQGEVRNLDSGNWIHFQLWNAAVLTQTVRVR